MLLKKVILFFSLSLSVTGIFGQELISKKGEPYLPEAGDWAIGIEATPFFEYFGKMLSNSGAEAPKFNFLSGDNILLGKYFKTNKMVYRMGLRLGIVSQTVKVKVANRAPSTNVVFPTPISLRENSWTSNLNTFGLSGGVEYRKGKTRLQGFYGGEAALFLQSSKNTYRYGNVLSISSTVPVNVDPVDDALNFGDWDNDPTTPDEAANILQDTYGNVARMTQSKSGVMFAFGIRGFIGAEYFILPKISIGGEFGWGIGFATTGKAKYTTESIDANTKEIGIQTLQTGRGSVFFIDNDNVNSFFGPSAGLRLNLHF